MTATLAPPARTETPSRRVDLRSVLVLGALHLGAVVGLVHAFRSPPSAKVWGLFIAMWLVPQLGITVGYHRMETHHGLKCHQHHRGSPRVG